MTIVYLFFALGFLLLLLAAISYAIAHEKEKVAWSRAMQLADRVQAEREEEKREADPAYQRRKQRKLAFDIERSAMADFERELAEDTGAYPRSTPFNDHEPRRMRALPPPQTVTLDEVLGKTGKDREAELDRELAYLER